MTLPGFLRRLQASERRRYRWLEMAPGLLVWLTLILAITLSFVKPVWVIAFVLVFDVYWVVRVSYVMLYLIMAFRRYRQAQSVDWFAQVQTLQGWERVHHLIMLPTYGESEEVLRATFTSLTQVNYPLDRCIIVLATEARAHQTIAPIAERLVQEFGPRFRHMLVTEHPADVPGEVAGKGANIAYAGRQIQSWIDQARIPYDDILVSTFDADSVAHRHYFSYLTYTFLRHPDRLHTSYQPIPLFHNNIWDTLALTRVVATSTTFWLLGETMRPDRLFTFSSHSMPWRALVDVGFWQNDVVSEDSRIFLQCYLRYDGHYTVTPMYIPISMDAVQSESVWKSLRGQYLQIRRWAYGVENFPFMVWNFFQENHIPWRERLRLTWNQLEGAFSWAVAPLLILILGWLPFHSGRPVLDVSVLAQNSPSALQALMSGAMVGLVVSAIISTALLPHRPTHVPVYRLLVMVGQWILLPVTMIVFGSLPAIEAQTRLMFGRYLGFKVTEKVRHDEPKRASKNPG